MTNNVLHRNNLYEKILEKVDTGIYFVDRARNLVFWNKGAEKITGFSKSEIMGKYCYDNILNHVNEAGCNLCLNGCPLEATVRDGEERSEIVYLHHKLGHRVRVKIKAIAIYEESKIIGCVEMFEPCVESNLNREFSLPQSCTDYTSEELRIFALYDQLTEIPNRRYLESTLHTRFMEYELLGLPFGLLFMDIDHFRDFNNAYGHDVGDKILKMVSKTFLSAIRKTDFIGRWGGEEFVGIFPMVGLKELSYIAEKIRVLTNQSIIREPNGQKYQVTISLGGTVARPGDTMESILKRADEQMYLSKKNGRNQSTLI